MIAIIKSTQRKHHIHCCVNSSLCVYGAAVTSLWDDDAGGGGGGVEGGGVWKTVSPATVTGEDCCTKAQVELFATGQVFPNPTRQMERFLNLLDLFKYISIWWRAHSKHLKRGAPLQKGNLGGD